MIAGQRFAVFAMTLAAAGTSTPASAQTSAAPVRLAIQSDKTGATIERDIFGQFAEHLGTGIYGGVWVGKDSSIPNVRGIRSDVVQALRAIRVPNVRWPGGCFADGYHWRDGIGPTTQRKHRLNASWGNVIEPNSFGTHEFFDFAEQVGAEVFLSVNVGSGSVQEAADWLEYLTADKPTSLAQERAANGRSAPYKVKYLGLGNENWACGGGMSNEHYVEMIKQFAIFSRNLDPAQAKTMKRVAVGWDSNKDDYTESVMKAWKARNWAWSVEGVSLHGYTIPNSWEKKGPSVGFGEDEYAKALHATLKMKDWIAQQSAIMDRYDPEKAVGLYVDEWGIWADPNPGSNPGFLQQQNTMRDAVIASLNLNIFIRNADRVKGTNIAQMINVLQAMILTDGPKMVLTPTYHAYHLYVPFQGAKVIPVNFEAGSYTLGDIILPRVDAVAARDSSGKLWLALTNVDPNRAAKLSAAIAGARGATGRVLTAATVDAHNDFNKPDAVAPRAISGRLSNGQLLFDLPPKSVAVVQIQ
jgi:alpha-N-arabinofuranosidase